MDNSFQKRFPRYLSSPLQIFIFETDELGMVFFFLLLSQMFSGWYMYLLLIIAPWVYKNMKRNHPRGFLRHLLYVVGIVQFKNCPNYFDKTFRE